MTTTVTEHTGAARIHAIMTAFLQSQAVFAAVEVGVFSSLAQGPRSLEELAGDLGLERRPVLALVRALVRLDLVRNTDGILSNAPDAQTFLVDGTARYMGGFAAHQEANFRSFCALTDAIRTNRSVTKRVLHDGYRDQGAAEGEGKEGTARLMQAMRVSSRMQAGLLAQALPDDLRRLVDLGCGSGDYSIACARAHPEAKIVSVDYPNVCEIVRQNLREAGLDSVVDVIPQDIMRDPLPEADDVLLSHVLDGYGTETSLMLLERIRRHLPRGGRLFVHSHMPSLATGAFPSFFGLILLVNTDTGEVHDADDLARWLRTVGFRDVVCRPATPLSGLITATV
jgi:N,N-dimethyltransferase